MGREGEGSTHPPTHHGLTPDPSTSPPFSRPPTLQPPTHTLIVAGRSFVALRSTDRWRRVHRPENRHWCTPGGPITGRKVVPSSWPPQSGPMPLAGDTSRRRHSRSGRIAVIRGRPSRLPQKTLVGRKPPDLKGDRWYSGNRVAVPVPANSPKLSRTIGTKRRPDHRHR
jgi:hypothetical protein